LLNYLYPLLKSTQGGIAFANGEAESLANFIRDLSHNRAKAERMGELGRQYVQENFTPKLIAKQYLAVLKTAAKW